MITLDTLQNSSSERKKCKRVGRGPGSGTGKTCGRGEKGAGSRSGYKRREGYEGGQMRLFMKMPKRGFSNVRFQKKLDVVNLGQVDAVFEDGDVVNLKTLKERGFIGGKSNGVKLLGEGQLSKKVKIEVEEVSAGAQAKLEKAKIKWSSK